MFRVLEVPPEGLAVLTEGPGSVAPPPEGTLRWIDLEAQDDEQLELLRARFGFHPLAIEDCAHFDQRGKLEEYDGYLFIVVHSFTARTDDVAEVEAHEVHAFLGPRYLVTVHTDRVPALTGVWRRVGGDAALARRGVDFVYYLLADALVDAAFPILDSLDDALEEVEEAILGRARAEDLGRIFHLRRALTTMRRMVTPQREVFAALAKRGDPRIGERTAFYFRDVYDHLVRITESIDAGRDLLASALDAYLSMVSNRTNEVMKRLTILSAIFLPLAFLTGFFGQNFEALPFGSWPLFWGVFAATIVLPPAMLLWFRKNGWL